MRDIFPARAQCIAPFLDSQPNLDPLDLTPAFAEAAKGVSPVSATFEGSCAREDVYEP